MDSTKFLIRFALRDDCKELFRLSQELAAFGQNISKIDPEALARDGFDCDPPRFLCFVVENTCHAESTAVEATLCGYALYYPIYSTREGKALWLEDIYVSPSCRSSGIGNSLFTRVVQEAYAGEFCRLDFSVYEWNPASAFYSKLGAENISDSEKWTLWRLNQAGIASLVKQQLAC